MDLVNHAIVVCQFLFGIHNKVDLLKAGVGSRWNKIISILEGAIALELIFGDFVLSITNVSINTITGSGVVSESADFECIEIEAIPTICGADT